MAGDAVFNFLAELGINVDSSAFAKAEAAAAQTERRITAAQSAEMDRRVDAELKGNKKRLTLKEQLARLVENLERDRADRVDAIQKEQADRAEKRDAEQIKHAVARRDALLKSTRALTVGMASFATGLAAGVTGAATGLLWATERAARHFERLGYAGQASGSSARGLSRVGYAASQSGTSAEDAQGSVAAFGENLKKLPALEGMLKSMGIATRDSNGALRDASALMVEYIDHLKELPQLQREARASGWGISDTTTRAVVRDGFHGFEREYDRIQGTVGADPNAAAQGAMGFEQAIRRGFEIIGAVKTRVETALFDIIKPRLDDISKWVLDHGDAISNVVTSISKGLTDLAAAFVKSDVVQSALGGIGDGLERFAKYVASDDFKRDVKGFVDDVKALAHAIRSALEFIGVLPSRSGAAVPDPQIGSHDPGGGQPADIWYRGMHGRHPGDLSPEQAEKARAALAGIRSGGGPGALRTDQQKANAAAIADEMRKAQLPDEGMAAGLGSMQTESSFNPRAHNDANGGHTGLWQWDATRWPKIRAWIEKQGGDPWDARWQTKAWIAEGRAKPGDAIYDTGETSAGFRDIENSKGDLGKAVHGVQRSERFSIGEEGGRAAHAAKWLGHLPGRDATDTPQPSAPSAAPARRITDLDVMAARQRIAQGHPNPGDSDTVAAYLKQENTPKQGKPIPSWQSSDGSAEGITTVDMRDPRYAPKGDAKPVKVEVTEDSGFRLGKAFAASSPLLQGARGGGSNILAGLHASWQRYADAHGMQLHHPGQPLGVTPSLYQAYDNSRKRGDTHITHNPTFHITGHDVKSSMDGARMVADRGTKDLVRNMRAVEQ